jgi:hypothetical protein
VSANKAILLLQKPRNQQNQQGDNTQGNSIANQVTSINPHTNAINNVQYSITKSSGITIEKNDTANLTN